jgi:hypothetical protein
MPVTEPLTEELNLTPSSTELPSPESAMLGAAKLKIVSSGVTAVEALEAALGPIPLVARTVKV